MTRQRRRRNRVQALVEVAMAARFLPGLPGRRRGGLLRGRYHHREPRHAWGARYGILDSTPGPRTPSGDHHEQGGGALRASRSQAFHRDSRGQATVEFALVVTIFLTMFFAVVDFGRMLAIHAAAVTSSREAARFGSALGYPAASTPQYLDCAGIENAARSVAGVLLPSDAVITVAYDRGPMTSPHADCDTDSPLPAPTRDAIQSLDRVIVTTTVRYRPLVPLFEPIMNEVTVVSSDRRTIVKA